jgi:Arc/MetJ-type ribon-helix-helix transcriptional regulator
MTVELKPEQEQIIQQQLASGHFKSVDEVLAAA